MRILIAVSGIALLLVAGCASQTPSATSSAPSETAAAPATPLDEPFRSVLTRWNYYRASAGVPPIVAEPELNQAALHHAKYLVENHIDAGDAVIRNGRMIENGWSDSAHTETPGNPWYTTDGAKWAAASTIIRGPAIPLDGTALVDGQAARISSTAVISPQLTAVGFARFCDHDDCAGIILYHLGLTKAEFLALYEGNAMDWNPDLGAMPYTTARLRKPIEFPADGMQFPTGAEWRGEFPDPLASCHGFSMPVGVPIVLELGAPSAGDNVKVSSSSISDGGSEIETCAFDATSYTNPDEKQQTMMRRGLHDTGTVIVIPKDPLQPGHRYTVSVAADSTPYTWSFSIAPDAK